MICVDYACERCANYTGLKDGWQPTCKAFPEGIPTEITCHTDVTKLNECNNGVKYSTGGK